MSDSASVQHANCHVDCVVCIVGLAVDKDGVLYIADGVTLRTVDERGRIATVIGSRSSSTSWRPLLCYRTVAASQVSQCECMLRGHND